jgi:hypothetical protein
VPLLYFDTDADTALARLEADPSQSLLLRRMNELLDVLETDPADPRVRRVRFQRPRLWCFTVFTADEEWAVLWEPHPEEADAVIVRYLAPASFA